GPGPRLLTRVDSGGTTRCGIKSEFDRCPCEGRWKRSDARRTIMSLYSSVAPSHRPDSSRLHGGESGAALRVEIANGDPRRMAAAQALVRRRYAETGLGTHALPVAAGDEGMTLLVWQGECPVGTLTLRFDGPGGLGAGEQYRNQLEALCGQGARLCEAVRLAFEPSFGTPRNLAKLFETAFEAACRGVLPSDVVIECHPRHARFYRRVLGMAQLGPLSLCRRVHAPAVLMHLPLARLAAWLGRTAGWTRH